MHLNIDSYEYITLDQPSAVKWLWAFTNFTQMAFILSAKSSFVGANSLFGRHLQFSHSRQQLSGHHRRAFQHLPV
jgi:hypothetical protein